MASAEEIERTYDFMDEALRRALGECPDLSCAFYDGDYSQTLEGAQSAKHDYVLESIRFRPSMRVLDVGCGWGPILRAVRDRGGHAVGVTLSPKQAEACRRNGLEVYLRDWKDVTPDSYGTFDGIVSLGALEHFCSAQEYLQGRQESIYCQFFDLCRELLPPGGRLYLQTMVWDKPPPYHNAAGFALVSCNSGRADYIHTMNEWRRRSIWRKALRPRLLMPLTARYMTSREFRYQLESLRRSSNRLCFEREIMDHLRMVFEKVEPA